MNWTGLVWYFLVAECQTSKLATLASSIVDCHEQLRYMCKGVKPQLPNCGPLVSQFSRQPRLAIDGQRQLATPINLPCQPLQPIRPTHPSKVVLVATSGHADWPRAVAAFLVAECDLGARSLYVFVFVLCM